MLTDFGRYLRKLRIDCGELIRDMAGRLGVTASYLSAVETGKRNIPETWVDEIAVLYSLNDAAKRDLDEAAVNSAKTLKIGLEEVSVSRKEAAILFAREFKDLDDATILQIRDLLKKRPHGE